MDSAETIKSVIESRACPIHDVYPIVEVTGYELKIGCCCTEFHDECAKEVKGLFMTNPDIPYWTLA